MSTDNTQQKGSRIWAALKRRFGPVVDWDRITRNHRSHPALAKELLLGRGKKPVKVYTDFHALRARNGLTINDLSNNYRAFQRSCLVSYCAAGIVAAWLVLMLVFARWMDALGAFGIWSLFASNATRYSFYCYEYRLQRFVPFGNWLRDRSAWWPADWTCPAPQSIGSQVVLVSIARKGRADR